jgi:hypothetical protein
VQRIRRQILVASLLASAGFVACLYPTDKSGELEVQMIQVPTLFLKDSLQLQGRVLDGSGNSVANAVISYSSADPTIVSVDPEGLLRAVAVGTTQVTATAVEFSEADPVTRTAIVRGLLEVDSVVPMTARFGEFVSLYGVGLEPDSLFAVSIGGVQAEIYDFTPADPENPGQFGRLTLWTPPPAERRSDLTVLGFKGGVVFPESLQVIQRDIYEPNDTASAPLGNVPFGFRNPALAFEVVPRDGTAREPADWYSSCSPRWWVRRRSRCSSRTRWATTALLIRRSSSARSPGPSDPARTSAAGCRCGILAPARSSHPRSCRSRSR